MNGAAVPEERLIPPNLIIAPVFSLPQKSPASVHKA